jgi:hypothetical protein
MSGGGAADENQGGGEGDEETFAGIFHKRVVQVDGQKFDDGGNESKSFKLQRQSMIDVGDTEADDRQQGKGKRNGFTRITLIYANQRCSDGDGMAGRIRPTRPRPILKTGPSGESAVSSNKFIEFVHFGRWNFCW